MKRLLFTALAILAVAGSAEADCGYFHQCSLDGATLTLEDTYYNGIHRSERWGHTALGGEHHYIIVQCS